MQNKVIINSTTNQALSSSDRLSDRQAQVKAGTGLDLQFATCKYDARPKAYKLVFMSAQAPFMAGRIHDQWIGVTLCR